MLTTLIALIITSQVSVNWNESPNQYWIGKNWHANRLQDWQVLNNKIICTEVSQRLPMRTVHLLTADTNGTFKAEVVTGTIDPIL